MLSSEEFWPQATDIVLKTRNLHGRFARRFALVNGLAELGADPGDKTLGFVALFGQNNQKEFSARIVSSIFSGEVASPFFLSNHQGFVYYDRNTGLLTARDARLLTDFLPDVPHDRGNVVGSMDIKVSLNQAAASWVGEYVLRAAIHLY